MYSFQYSYFGFSYKFDCNVYLIL